jgi:hypothetical protein
MSSSRRIKYFFYSVEMPFQTAASELNKLQRRTFGILSNILFFGHGSHTQNYWVFELCPSSGILETRKHNVSETGTVSVLR